MELRVSSLKPRGLSPSDCASDPDEKEISDEDDDDRNHKHRRREAQSHSFDRDTEPAFATSYRKRDKPFENGHMFRGNGSNNNFSMEKDFAGKFEKRRPSQSRGTGELNHRIRGNQTYSLDQGPGRGRGRDFGGWNRDSRFNAIEGPIGPSIFAGRGMPSVPNAQSGSWNAFGLVPLPRMLPNGGLDTLHPIGLQGIRPPLNSSMTMGIPRQRCRDFEERGFCLRGDMCPMEHGVNRIVVEDVQSLSQFNLPVSLASSQLVGPPTGPGPLSSLGVSSNNTIINNKTTHSRTTTPNIPEDGLPFSSAYPSSANMGGSDFYDPDQPLWNNNFPETSAALVGPHSPKIDDESLLNADPSDNEDAIGSSKGTSLSVWGRINNSRNKIDVKEKNDSTINPSDHLGNEIKEDQGKGKKIFANDAAGPKVTDSSSKIQGDSTRHIRRPSQKALRTLFVNGIPLESNKREKLLSHFSKFGEVIDIYIPINSERAFVQFSKRDEAESALKSPDAVMGNRFIKLWWANRDSIPENGGGPSSSVSVTPHVSNKGKYNVHASASKGNAIVANDSGMPVSDQPKPAIPNGPNSNAAPLVQKKMESLEQLKEELRKKQEMLDQKRNDFRRKLDQFKKQATGVKGEPVYEQSAKRHKAGVSNDVEQAAVPTQSSEPGAALASPRGELMTDKNKSTENNIVAHNPKINPAMVTPESMGGSKQPIRPVAATGSPFLMNRYKLDNRPTAFRISPPLPLGLTNMAALKEHFSSYGELSNVEIEETDSSDGIDGSEAMNNCSARITFATRRSAEKAFINAKSWQTHNLKFSWITPTSSSSNNPSGRENSSISSTWARDNTVQPTEDSASTDSKEDNGEEKTPERKTDIELPEDSKPCATPASDKKESSPEGSG
ncbi:hypothetical protein ACFE04_009649 [Oxalis oulophora]